MIKRTPPNKLTIYRRHAGLCPMKDDKRMDQCECPLWTHGKVRGKFIRQSLDTRSLATALQRKEDLLHGHNNDDPNGGLQVVKNVPKDNITLEYAQAEWLKANSQLAIKSRRNYGCCMKDFLLWANRHEITRLAQIEVSHVAAFFAEMAPEMKWTKTTCQNKLTFLRVFFNYCHRTRHWIPYTPTADRTLNQRKQGTSSTRVPFTPAEISRILFAVEKMPLQERDRARALILLLLYTGMRISDATFFERSYVTERNTADYFIIKTRKQVALPPELQAPVLKALKKLPKSRVYFFQPDAPDDYREARRMLREGEEFQTAMPQYEHRVREMGKLVVRVLERAGLEGAAHRFRDTFAVSLLIAGLNSGADMLFTVSQMLGHSDVRVTQRNYVKLIFGYNERMSQATRALTYKLPVAC